MTLSYFHKLIRTAKDGNIFLLYFILGENFYMTFSPREKQKKNLNHWIFIVEWISTKYVINKNPKTKWNTHPQFAKKKLS